MKWDLLKMAQSTDSGGKDTVSILGDLKILKLLNECWNLLVHEMRFSVTSKRAINRSFYLFIQTLCNEVRRRNTKFTLTKHRLKNTTPTLLSIIIVTPHVLAIITVQETSCHVDQFVL